MLYLALLLVPLAQEDVLLTDGQAWAVAQATLAPDTARILPLPRRFGLSQIEVVGDVDGDGGDELMLVSHAWKLCGSGPDRSMLRLVSGKTLEVLYERMEDVHSVARVDPTRPADWVLAEKTLSGSEYPPRLTYRTGWEGRRAWSLVSEGFPRPQTQRRRETRQAWTAGTRTSRLGRIDAIRLLDDVPEELDGDGRKECLVAHQTDGGFVSLVSSEDGAVLWSVGAPPLATPVPYDDLDHDGMRDVAVLSFDPAEKEERVTVHVDLRSGRSGKPLLHTELDLASDLFPFHARDVRVIADLDGDGRSELALTCMSYLGRHERVVLISPLAGEECSLETDDRIAWVRPAPDGTLFLGLTTEDEDHRLATWRNGHLEILRELTREETPPWRSTLAAIGDLDGNGEWDLLLATNDRDFSPRWSLMLFPNLAAR